MFDRLINKFKRKAPQADKPKREPRPKKLSPKEQATQEGKPWIQVLNVELDPDNPGLGAFELDWNEKFVANLVRAGYQGKTDQDIVDNWFQDICRHVVLETFQQEQADPDKRGQNTVQRKDIGGGRSEFS